jgi:hypothetical protein
MVLVHIVVVLWTFEYQVDVSTPVKAPHAANDKASRLVFCSPKSNIYHEKGCHYAEDKPADWKTSLGEVTRLGKKPCSSCHKH